MSEKAIEEKIESLEDTVEALKKDSVPKDKIKKPLQWMLFTGLCLIAVLLLLYLYMV